MVFRQFFFDAPADFSSSYFSYVSMQLQAYDVNCLCINQELGTLFYGVSLRIMPLSVASQISRSPAAAMVVRLATAR